MRFEGKVAVVTGASRGIGRAIALALAKEGCSLIVNYNQNQAKAQEVVDAIKGMKSRAIPVRCDVSARNDVDKMFKLAVEEFGKIDILVNNAAIMETPLFLDTTDEVWDRSMNVNLKSVFICTQIAARHMIPRKYGKIVNIASNSGIGTACTGDVAYGVAKAGVIQLTKHTALELGQYGINVNCIAPGATETEMLRGNMTDQQYSEFIKGRKSISSLGVVGRPEDIANVALFFASDESRFVTGRTLLVDGGRRDFI
ncbi:MAG TPA: glucose 1-dehydrogenase [Methylomirabilota bacterium]|nr:glucose 1-dehydrogenase [Methylomirabilota bacterium]